MRFTRILLRFEHEYVAEALHKYGVNGETWFLGVIAIVGSMAISGCETMPASELASQPSVTSVEATAAHTAVVQSLQRQVRERDRRIADLTYQLEALKRIDQEADIRRQ
jgi:hypothetical protein